MSTSLEKLLQDNPAVWRGRETAGLGGSISTGFAELDAALPSGGWPANALVEIVTAFWGIGEVQLLAPVMARLSRQQYWVVWIAPPYVPYAPALEQHGIDLERMLVLALEDADQDILWSMEKVLRAEACGMALAWPHRLPERAVRRLQLAAESGRSLGVILRTRDTARSPAALRLRLTREASALQVHIRKARGGCRHRSVQLKLNPAS